jgi:glycosyltransferase involved in cell wall biosynthesis
MGDGALVQIMKIAFVNDLIYAYASGSPSAIGGAERQQWLLARALGEAGWSVTVGVREGLEAGKERAINGVKFVGIGQSPILQTLQAWYRFLASERPDWFYWRCADHLLGPAVQIAKLARVRTIFSAAFDTDVHPRRALTRRRRWWPLYAWGLYQAERLFVQHGGQLSELPLKWRSKAYVVPSIAGDGVSVIPHSKRESYVAWVGALRQHKRPELLIEIARKTPAIEFVVCGGPTSFGSPPGYGERIMEILRGLPNVEFLGQVSPARAQQVVAEAAVLLSTSNVEGFPNTFLQAWLSGTPVVSLQVDPDRIIERMGLGAVPGSVEGAIADISALVDSGQLRERIADCARQYVAENHSEAVVVRAFTRAVNGACS